MLIMMMAVVVMMVVKRMMLVMIIMTVMIVVTVVTDCGSYGKKIRILMALLHTHQILPKKIKE